MTNEEIADKDDFSNNPEETTPTNIVGADVDPEEALEALADPGEALKGGLQVILLESKYMDQLNPIAKSVMTTCFNYTLAVFVVLASGLNCNITTVNTSLGKACEFEFLVSNLNVFIILSGTYGILIGIITWVHGTYFSKKKGKSKFENVYDFTDNFFVIDSLIEIPIALYAAPYVTIVLWINVLIIGVSLFLLSSGVGAGASVTLEDPAKILSDFVAIYHLYKLTGDFSQYYVLNKTTDTSPEGLQKVEKYKKNTAERQEKWAPKGLKKSQVEKSLFGRYFKCAIVFILFAFIFSFAAIVMIGIDSDSDEDDEENSDSDEDDLSEGKLISTCWITFFSFVSFLLLIKATAGYKATRNSTGIAGCLYIGWFCLLIGALEQIFLLVGDQGTLHEIINTCCILSYGTATLFIIIHALAARQI